MDRLIRLLHLMDPRHSFTTAGDIQRYRKLLEEHNEGKVGIHLMGDRPIWMLKEKLPLVAISRGRACFIVLFMVRLKGGAAIILIRIIGLQYFVRLTFELYQHVVHWAL